MKASAPPAAARRARWVLDALGARNVELGDDVPFRPEAWEELERGERPRGDELADAFFHLARIEERAGLRDQHGRFPVEASVLDPLDPPLEHLRRTLDLEPPRWRGARFAVALTHDVDTPWRWTRAGVRGGARRMKEHVFAGRPAGALAEARGLAAAPLHRVRGTDPNWRFEAITEMDAERATASTFFLMAGHGHPADGAVPEAYERLRPRLVQLLRERGAEIALHGSYTAAEDETRLADEKALLEALAGPVAGQRFHYLRVDPDRNLGGLERLGFAYDTSLGFAGALGFRAGIAQPFRPWDGQQDRPLDLIEIPLAIMDVTLGEERYLGLSARQAETRIQSLLDWAAENGGGFALLWHTDRFDPFTARGWDRLYSRILDGVRERGGICVSAGELAEEAAAWLR
jgi:hypothetical protein